MDDTTINPAGTTLLQIDDTPAQEPKQRTPKGLEIPVPTREAFLRDLEKVAKSDDVAKKQR